MKIVAVTQARSGSTRLPNKVLKTINGKTLLELHVNRIKQAKLLNQVIIATTVKKEDDVIEQLAKSIDVKCSRGSEENVLDRFYQAVKNENADYIVRLTSDCPLIDPLLIDEVVSIALKKELDYYSNGLIESFPDGQDIEVFKFSVLETAWENAILSSDKEHVTPYIRKNSSFYNKKPFKSDNHLSETDYKSVRLTVDEPNDFVVIKHVIEALGDDKGWKEYANYYINNEEIKKLNSSIVRNEGYIKSLKNDN